MLGRTICKRKDEKYTRLSGCATIPGILALLLHTKQRLGPVRWLELMRRRTSDTMFQFNILLIHNI